MPRSRAPHLYAVGLQLGHIAQVGRVFPHLPVHCRHYHQRAGTGRGHGADQVVTRTVCQLENTVGSGRYDQEHVGTARHLDMRHRVVRARVPDVTVDRVAGQCLEGGRGHKAGSGLAHHHFYVMASLDQQPGKLCRFIGSDAAGNAKKDAFLSHVAACLS